MVDQRKPGKRTVILGEPEHETTAAESRLRWPTLDDLFREALERHGDAVAIVDPPDRAAFADGAPRRLNWLAADHAVAAIAQRLQSLGLPTDSVVALQFPNIVEGALALLGVVRAGMIAAPLPLLWSRAEAVDALRHVGARAIITCCRAGPLAPAETASRVAADLFMIRFVCAFGTAPPDGVMALDDIFAAPHANLATLARAGDPAAHVAVVTFDVTAEGLVPVARSHSELIAGGLSVALEGRLERDAAMLGAVMPSSFAGLASTIVPWLITGGTLSLYQPADAATLASLADAACGGVAVLPGPVAMRLKVAGEGGRLGPRMLALWRAPDGRSGILRARATGDGLASPGLVDLFAFGEIGIVAPRPSFSRLALPLGAVPVPGNRSGVPVLIDIRRTSSGTIALGGAMVARHAFPRGEPSPDAPSIVATDGFVDTGYACRVDRDGMLAIDGPPPGLITIGGYRFALRRVQELIGGLVPNATVAALPDSLTGHRLAGIAEDRAAVRQALLDRGASPLLVAAFAERNGRRASAA